MWVRFPLRPLNPGSLPAGRQGFPLRPLDLGSLQGFLVRLQKSEVENEGSEIVCSKERKEW